MYNNGMGNVDVADKLRGVYRFDRWLRNRKWWWSLMFWYISVLLTNAYKFYMQMYKEEDRKPWYKEQYKFRKAISEYCINPELVTSEKESKKSKFELEMPPPSTLSIISLLSPGTLTRTKIATDLSSKQRTSRVENASLESTERLGLQ